MRTFTFLSVAVAIDFVTMSGFASQETVKDAEAERMAHLIKQLGHEEFAKREEASKELEALGEKALGALAKAAADNTDLEIRGRTERLIAAIADKLARTDVNSVPPPKGAVILFDGKNLDAWVGREAKSGPAWRLLSNGVMEAQGTDIQTWQTFADGYKLHVEFRIPHMPNARGQARGNSGVYLQGRYEVQILDSHGLPPDPGSCGAVFGVAAPRVNACKAPAVWQSYDIEFHPPQFKNGTKVKHANVTVAHNGILIHDRMEIPTDNTGSGLPGDRGRPGILPTDNTENGLPDDLSAPGPVLLQYHGSPVQFRNLWLLPLPKP